MSKTSDLIILFLRFFDEHDLRVKKYAIENKLKQFLYFSSLEDLQDILSLFNFKTLLVDMSFEELDEVPMPFFAQNLNGDFVLVVGSDEDGFNCFSVEEGKGLITYVKKERLNKLLINIFLLSEKTSRSGNIQSERQRINQIITESDGWFAFIIFTSWVTYSWSIMSRVFFFLFCINIFGSLVSYLLLRKDFGQDDRLADYVCNFSTRFSCDAVLKSTLSKKLKPFSIAGFSFNFFIGNALLVCWDTSSIVLYTISILGGLVVLFTIYYQWIIVKKWCVLCLLIATVVWLNLVFLYLTQSHMGMNYVDGIAHVFLYLAAFMLYLFLRNKLDLKKQYRTMRNQLNWFKGSRQIFNFTLTLNPVLNTPFNPPFVFGSEASEKKLDIILHPNCSACHSLFIQLRNILDLDEELQVAIAIAYDSKDLKAISNFMQLYSKEKKEALCFLEKWLAGDDFIWLDGFGKNKELLAINNEFIDAVKPRYFPTVFLDRQLVPTVYSSRDLKILLAK